MAKKNRNKRKTQKRLASAQNTQQGNEAKFNCFDRLTMWFFRLRALFIKPFRKKSKNITIHGNSSEVLNCGNDTIIHDKKTNVSNKTIVIDPPGKQHD